jgi:hypothetical protein
MSEKYHRAKYFAGVLGAKLIVNRAAIIIIFLPWQHGIR